MMTIHEMCVNANHVDDNAPAQHLQYKFGVHSSFFAVLLRLQTIEVETCAIAKMWLYYRIYVYMYIFCL